MSIKFEFLEHGDCTVITTNEFTMMIDGGYNHPFEAFEFEGEQPQIDSVVVTHIDRDHIGGVIDCFKDLDFVINLKHVVFNEPEGFSEFIKPSNSTEISKSDGNLLNTLIKTKPSLKAWSCIYTDIKEQVYLDESITGTTKFTVLSPSSKQLCKLYKEWHKDLYKPEDTQIFGKADDFRTIPELLKSKENYNDSSTPNGSSLAFLIENKGHKFMILGDAHVKQIINQLKSMGYQNKDGKRLPLDFIKLSHHGSKKSTSPELLGLIDTDTYIISKPSPTFSKNPDRETIARIVSHGKSLGKRTKIFINDYDVGDLNFSENERGEYLFSIAPTSKHHFEYS